MRVSCDEMPLSVVWRLTPLAEICDDVRDECQKYGTILELKVPRPSGGSKQSAGVGKIYVKFDSPESATKALKALAGRKFADRTVVTTYFPEVSLMGRMCIFWDVANEVVIGKLRGRRVVDIPSPQTASRRAFENPVAGTLEGFLYGCVNATHASATVLVTYLYGSKTDSKSDGACHSLKPPKKEKLEKA